MNHTKETLRASILDFLDKYGVPPEKQLKASLEIMAIAGAFVQMCRTPDIRSFESMKMFVDALQ